MVSSHFPENYLSHSFHIAHAGCLSEDMTPIDIEFTIVKGQGHKDNFANIVTKGFRSLSWELFISELS